MSFSSIRRMILPAALLTASLAVPAADAAPPVTPLNCAGTSYAGTTVTPYGATFQIKAQDNSFIPQYNTDCGANRATIHYNKPNGVNLGPRSGSGLCVTYMTSHTPPTVTSSPADPNYGSPYTYPAAPYCGSDDPLTTAQWQAANSTGLVVNQIPVALGANAIVYNAGAASCGAGLDLTSAQLSGIFAGTLTNLNQVGCTGSQAITRVVRNAGSGTTCIFKSYLAKRNPLPWAQLNNDTGCGSTSWPAGTPIVQANGNSGLVSTVSATPGGISYPDLASDVTAANALINPVARVKTVVQELTSASGENPYVGTSTSVGASNCQGNSPTPAHTSSPGWDAVTISDGPQGYPICGFTYVFAYTQCSTHLSGLGVANATAQCRIAQDLVSAAVSAGGQAQLGPDHYAPLPQNAVVVAQAGAQTIL